MRLIVDRTSVWSAGEWHEVSIRVGGQHGESNGGVFRVNSHLHGRSRIAPRVSSITCIVCIHLVCSARQEAPSPDWPGTACFPKVTSLKPQVLAGNGVVLDALHCKRFSVAASRYNT